MSALACGPSGGKPAGIDTDVCADYAANYCNRLAACSPYLISKQFGDTARCIARRKPICQSAMQAPGTGFGREQVAACAGATMTASCEDTLLVGWQPAACAVKGTLADGAACGHRAQCASGHCSVMSFSQVCGTCAAPIPSGGSCSRHDDCEAGLACLNSGKCGLLSPRGASCRTTPCAFGLRCINGTCDNPQTLGATCDPVGGGACNDRLGLYCDSETLRCTQSTFAATGGACSNIAMVCLASGTCNESAVCEAALADGAACPSDRGCESPAVCVSGVCRLPDATTCH